MLAASVRYSRALKSCIIHYFHATLQLRNLLGD